MNRPRSTLAEVAAAAGVSIATVSKVLNGREDVAPATRRRVQEQLRDADYRPVNRPVRNEGIIELAFPDWQHAYTVTVLESVTAAAQAAGFDVAIAPRSAEGQIDLDLSRLRASGRVGAILIAVDASLSSIRTLADDGFPVAVVDPVRVGSTHCVTIGATNFAGGVTATEHLISLGHRRIAHAAGPTSVDCSQARLGGHLSALRQAGLAVDESLITHGELTYDGGRAAAETLLSLPDRPTAIFAASDEVALGIIDEARRRSLRVPQDLSIVGFDDSYIASRSAPQLTTVAQPLVEMGQIAARAISELISGTIVGTRHIELATSLVVRESTAPPPRSVEVVVEPRTAATATR